MNRCKEVRALWPLWGLLALALLMGLVTVLSPYSATVPSGASLQAPGREHLLGTDSLGIDVLAQLAEGFFLSLGLGLGCAALSLLLGGVLGVLAGFRGGLWDRGVGFVTEVFLALPQLPALIVLGAFLGQSRWLLLWVITLFSWAPIAKQVRAKTLSLRGRPYIALAQSFGGGVLYLLRQHLLPELYGLLLVCGTGVIGKAILQESALAFLGLSDPLAKSWGLMLNRATAFPGIYFTPYWTWWVLGPAGLLVLTLFLLRMLCRALEHRYLKGGPP